MTCGNMVRVIVGASWQRDCIGKVGEIYDVQFVDGMSSPLYGVDMGQKQDYFREDEVEKADGTVLHDKWRNIWK